METFRKRAEWYCMNPEDVDEKGLSGVCDPKSCDLECPFKSALAEASKWRVAVGAIPRMPEIASYEELNRFRLEMESWQEKLSNSPDSFTELSDKLRSDSR